jgi:hypothetical protein
MDIDERRTRLIGWLEVAMKDVENLLLRHHIFEELQSIVRTNERFASASGLFNEWVALSYTQSATVGVRRHLKVGDDSVSLKGCLEEIRKYPELVSRDFYIAFFADSPEWVTSKTGHKYFDSISDESGKHMRFTWLTNSWPSWKQLPGQSNTMSIGESPTTTSGVWPGQCQPSKTSKARCAHSKLWSFSTGRY